MGFWVGVSVGVCLLACVGALVWHCHAGGVRGHAAAHTRAGGRSSKVAPFTPRSPHAQGEMAGDAMAAVAIGQLPPVHAGLGVPKIDSSQSVGGWNRPLTAGCTEGGTDR